MQDHHITQVLLQSHFVMWLLLSPKDDAKSKLPKIFES